jgi:hypothetical protein
MAMRNRISPKNRDFVIDRERAPFDDNVNTGEGMYDAGGFMTTPQIDPREFPARKDICNHMLWVEMLDSCLE